MRIKRRVPQFSTEAINDKTSKKLGLGLCAGSCRIDSPHDVLDVLCTLVLPIGSDLWPGPARSERLRLPVVYFTAILKLDLKDIEIPQAFQKSQIFGIGLTGSPRPMCCHVVSC